MERGLNSSNLWIPPYKDLMSWTWSENAQGKAATRIYAYVQGSLKQLSKVKHDLISDILGLFGAREGFDQYIEKSLSEDGKPYFKCTICGKQVSVKTNLRNHIESAHFPGHFSYNCNHCGKIFKSKATLCNHVSQLHRDQKL